MINFAENTWAFMLINTVFCAKNTGTTFYQMKSLYGVIFEAIPAVILIRSMITYRNSSLLLPLPLVFSFCFGMVRTAYFPLEPIVPDAVPVYICSACLPVSSTVDANHGLHLWWPWSPGIAIGFTRLRFATRARFDRRPVWC